MIDLCYNLISDDERLLANVVSSELSVNSFEECLRQCLQRVEFCHVFSFHNVNRTQISAAERHDRGATWRNEQVDGNCLLSAVQYVSVVRDLSPRAGWDTVQVLAKNRAQCSQLLAHARDGLPASIRERCFRQPLSGKQLNSAKVRTYVKTSSLVRCLHSCLEASYFCTAFSYRTRLDPNELNCHLSEDADWRANLSTALLYDTYQREAGTGQDCVSVSDATAESANQTHLSTHSRCFVKALAGKTLMHRTAFKYVQVASLQECEEACMMYSGCVAYSHSDSSGSSNCVLSHFYDASLLISRPHFSTFVRVSTVDSCQTQIQKQVAHISDCFTMDKPGRRLHHFDIIDVSMETSMYACAVLCLRQKRCNSFSYKFFGTSDFDHNCALSGKSFARRTSRLLVDIFYNTYMKKRECQIVVSDDKPINDVDSNFYSNDVGCQFMFYLNKRLPTTSIGLTYPAESLHHCLGLCRLRQCRMFTYTRLQTRSHTGVSCQLAHAHVSETRLLEDPRAITLSRRGAGEDCGQMSQSDMSVTQQKSYGCYQLRHANTRLTNNIIDVYVIVDVGSCKQLCRRELKCLSFNAKYIGAELICELSATNSRYRSAHFSSEPDWHYYEKDTTSGHCLRSHSGHGEVNLNRYHLGYPNCSSRVLQNQVLHSAAVRKDVYAATLAECERMCRRETAFRCETYVFGIEQSSVRFTCQLSDMKVASLTSNDLRARSNYEIYDFHGNGFDCSRYGDIYYTRHGRTMTSSGDRCARGPCRLERTAGYWYCYTDTARVTWDYCCDPESECDTDTVLNRDICYVKRQQLQRHLFNTAWRPCRRAIYNTYAYVNAYSNQSAHRST